MKFCLKSCKGQQGFFFSMFFVRCQWRIQSIFADPNGISKGPLNPLRHGAIKQQIQTFTSGVKRPHQRVEEDYWWDLTQGFLGLLHELVGWLVIDWWIFGLVQESNRGMFCWIGWFLFRFLFGKSHCIGSISNIKKKRYPLPKIQMYCLATRAIPGWVICNPMK